MASTPEERIAGFQHSNLPNVTGEPMFEDVQIIHRLLNSDSLSVSSYEGGGGHSHIGIIMTKVG
jgi:hypothetical protein